MSMLLCMNTMSEAVSQCRHNTETNNIGDSIQHRHTIWQETVEKLHRNTYCKNYSKDVMSHVYRIQHVDDKSVTEEDSSIGSWNAQ